MHVKSQGFMMIDPNQPALSPTEVLFLYLKCYVDRGHLALLSTTDEKKKIDEKIGPSLEKQVSFVKHRGRHAFPSAVRTAYRNWCTFLYKAPEGGRPTSLCSPLCDSSGWSGPSWTSETSDSIMGGLKIHPDSLMRAYEYTDKDTHLRTYRTCPNDYH